MNKRHPGKIAPVAQFDAERHYHAGQRHALGCALNAVQQAPSLEQARRSIKSMLADLKVAR